ncbi:MAG: hypothetical protein WA823_17615 [Candidatus Acidiferrales bacterium]
MVLPARGPGVPPRRWGRLSAHILALGRSIALFAAVFSAATPAFGQSAQKIVDEYVRAIGGAKVLEAVHSSSISGSIFEKPAEGGASDDSLDTSGTYALIVKAPNKYYSEFGLASTRTVVAYNGKSGWQKIGADAAVTLTGANAAACEAETRYLNGKLLHMKRDRILARVLETTNVHQQPAYHVELALSPGVKRELFFDTDTHLLVREIIPALAAANASGEGPSTTEQFDYFFYKPVSGIQEPQQIELTRNGRTYRISITRVEINSAVNDAVFNFPSRDSRPLPDIPQLLRDMNKNQRAIEEIQKLYTCHLNVEEQRFDSKGDVSSRTVKDYDLFFIGDNEVRRLLAKDGKPLEDDEKKKEDQRFSKEFDELKKKQADFESDPKKQAKQEERDDEQISDFLRAESFTNPRREIFRGHEVIVFDFAANPDYKPRNLNEQIAQKLGGVVWVDEEARDVARLEARFVDSAKIGGGLVGSLSKGSNLVIEQAKVNDEIWLPTYAEVHASARLAFLKFKANEIDRYSEYKKFSSQVKLGVSVPLGQAAAGDTSGGTLPGPPPSGAQPPSPNPAPPETPK